MADFQSEVVDRIAGNGRDKELFEAAKKFMQISIDRKYSYNFEWLGRPIIQYPQDIAAMQELIWSIKPDLIIETGVAHGGSLIFSASMLALLDMSEAIAAGEKLDPLSSRRRVIGIDIDIRSQNRAAIEAHPMASRIRLIDGSSIAPPIIEQVRAATKDFTKVFVCLDSNHTHDHVLAELEAYAPLATRGSYCVVFDTIVEDLPEANFPDRPWGPGNNPKTAIGEFVKRHPEFAIDKNIQDKLLITVAPDGYLKRVA